MVVRGGILLVPAAKNSPFGTTTNGVAGEGYLFPTPHHILIPKYINKALMGKSTPFRIPDIYSIAGRLSFWGFPWSSIQVSDQARPALLHQELPGSSLLGF